MLDIRAVIADLDGINLSAEAQVLRQKSHDFHWFSPILTKVLAEKLGELWVAPRNEDEVLRVLAVCRRHRVPVTVRGAATGNYGQCVPLQGGVILDMKDIDTLYDISPDGVAEVGGGAKMLDIDIWARDQGWELKVHPSTKRVATIGGFIAGGGDGMGAGLHGVMGARGNLLGVTIATMQDPPVLMELAGKETSAVVRSYGTTGVVTRVRFALKPAQAWRDLAVAFPTYENAARFGVALTSHDGIPVFTCQGFDAHVAKHFHRLSPVIPKDHALILAMVAPASLLAVREIVMEHGGAIVCEQDTVEAERERKMTPLYEYCNNHTLLSVLTRKPQDENYASLLAHFPTKTLDDTLKMMAEMISHFPDEMWRRNGFGRGGSYCSLLVRWTTAERFQAMKEFLEAQGVRISNIHGYTIEDSSAGRRPNYDQVAFKHRVDALGLLNPGKLASFVPMHDTVSAAE